MSYIRFGSDYKYVDSKEKSDSYVYPSSTGIECLGLSDKGIIELFCRCYDYENSEFTRFLAERLARRLNIKLRDIQLQTER